MDGGLREQRTGADQRHLRLQWVDGHDRGRSRNLGPPVDEALRMRSICGVQPGLTRGDELVDATVEHVSRCEQRQARVLMMTAISSLRSSLAFSVSSCSMRRSLASLSSLRPDFLPSKPLCPSRSNCARQIASCELYSRSLRSSALNCPRSVQASASARMRRLSSALNVRRTRRSW